MNAETPDLSRRRLFSRLLGEPAARPATSLQPVPAVARTGRNVYWSLAATAADDIFMAGDEGELWHFDGEEWHPERAGTSHNLHALCCVDDEIFAVGWQGVICARRDGHWHHLQGGANEPGRVNLPLFDIAADLDGRLWAVGDQGRIACYQQGEWSENSSGTSANLRSVLPLPDGRVLAAGLGGTLLEYAGDEWRTVTTGTGCPIVSMAALNEDTVVAVGGEYCVESQGFRGRIFLYRDDEFTPVEIAMDLPRLRRVRREGDNLLILGDSGAAFRWSADGVRPLPGAGRYDLHDVVSFAPGEALLCGDGEMLLQERPGEAALEELSGRVATRWQAIGEGLTRGTLRALWAAESDHIIAAGDGGYAIHYRAGKVFSKKLPGGRRVHALWGSSGRNVLAACDGASILHFDGERWAEVYSGDSDLPLLAITGFGPHDIFAVGDEGLALRYDGLMWRQLETPGRQELYGLWGQDSNHLLAVGGGGTVLRFDGQRWRQFTAGTEQDLYSVCGSGLNRLYLAGLGGTLIRFQDNQWHREFTGVRADLHAVAQAGDEFIAVGSCGTVLRSRGDSWDMEELDDPVTLQAALTLNNVTYLAGTNGTLLKAP